MLKDIIAVEPRENYQIASCQSAKLGREGKRIITIPE
jgi:hypothetical protein